jgi:L-amino acid N-acyltransferase YncA
MSCPPAIRPAVAADVAAIAGVHVRSWQWAYRGQVPDDYLDNLTARLAERRAWWSALIAAPPAELRLWVAEVEGNVVGFASTGRSRDPDATPAIAEVEALYLDPDVVGTGIGRALFATAVDDLRQRGYRRATLWVLASNARARRFYAAAGWRPDGTTKREERPGFILDEVRYQIDFAPAT